MVAPGEAVQARGVLLLPLCEQGVDGNGEGVELPVAPDGGLEVIYGELQAAVSGTARRLEQQRSQAGEDLPVAIQGVDVSFGDAAAQVAVDVL